MSQKIEVILLDIGNTLIKSMEVINGELTSHKTWNDLAEFNNYYHRNIPAMISSVGKFNEDLLSGRDLTILNYKTPLPIELDYKTPETLGVDRIAAAVGAWSLFPDRNSLVIDIGTCITIDFIASQGIFEGGAISPGLKMRMKSMAHYTDRLPDISEEWSRIDLVKPGKSTKECLLSGVFYGIVHELNGAIETFSNDFTSINVILTGGDAHLFESNLKEPIFAGSNLVLTGLYSIWSKTAIGNK